MASHSQSDPRDRTVRVVPWWAPAAAKIGAAILIVWVLGMLWLVIGAPAVSR